MLSNEQSRWLRPSWANFLFATLLSLAFAGPSFADDTADRGDIVVVSLRGDVQVTLRGEARAVKAGAVLELPAAVRTGKDGALELRQGRTTIGVGADSELQLPVAATLGDALDRVVQPRGNVFYDVGKRGTRKLRVETPYLVAVIKGTQFNVAVQEASSTVSLFEGRLEILATDGSDVVDLHQGEIAIRHRSDRTIRVIRMDTGEPIARHTRESDAVGTPPSDRGPDSNSDGSVPDGTSTPPTRVGGLIPAADVTVRLNGDSDNAQSGGETTSASVDTTVRTPSAVELGTEIGLQTGPKTDVTAGVDADVGIAGVDAGVGVSAGVNLGPGTVAVDTQLDVGIGAGGVAVDAGVGLGADLGAGAVSVDVDAGVGVGGVAAVDAGLGVGADLGAGTVDVGGTAAVDVGGAISAGLGLDTGVDLGAGSVSTGVDAGLGVGPVDTGVAADVGVAPGAVDVGIGVDVGGVSVGVDLGLGGAPASGGGGGGLLGGVGLGLDLGLDTTPAPSPVDTGTPSTPPPAATTPPTVLGGLLGGLLPRRGRP